MIKKKKKVVMGEYSPNDAQNDAFIWGMNNGIKICPKPTTKGPGPVKWYVEIYQKDRWVHSGKTYDPVEVWEVLYNYYLHYYEKRIQ